MTVYNSKKIAISINGVGVQLLGADNPTIAKSGEFNENVGGIQGDNHTRAINGVYNILTLPLKYNSPNIELLESLAENHTEFAATYKDGNTGKTYDTIAGVCRAVGDRQGDSDVTFTIDFK